MHILDDHSARGVAREPGIGVAFEGLSSEAQQQLRRFIDKIAAGPTRAGSAQSTDAIRSLKESELLIAAVTWRVTSSTA